MLTEGDVEIELETVPVGIRWTCTATARRAGLGAPRGMIARAEGAGDGYAQAESEALTALRDKLDRAGESN